MAAQHAPAQGSRRGRRHRRIAAMILAGMLAVCGFFPDTRISCEAKENDAEQEVIDFVKSYYRAESPEGIDTLADYVDGPETESFRIDLLRFRATCKHGVKGWENIKVIVHPMSDGKHWVVSASGDLIVEGFDVGIPGLRAMLVGRDKEGELKISSYAYDDYDVYSETFIKEMREIALSDEMVEHSNEIAMAYNELVAERSDIMEWVLNTDEAVTKEVGEILAREEALSEETDSEENPAAKKGSYTVKKGDCLWDIAEEQLGDGMLWSGIYEANKALIGENPDLLYVGISLQLN